MWEMKKFATKIVCFIKKKKKKYKKKKKKLKKKYAKIKYMIKLKKDHEILIKSDLLLQI